MGYAFQRRAENLVSALIQRTNSGHPCYGRYVLTIVGRPRIPKPSSRNGRDLLALACRYISVTGNEERQIPESLFHDASGEIMIHKTEARCGSDIVLVLQSATQRSN